MNRRSVLGALGIVPFAGKAIAETAVGGVIGPPDTPYPPSAGYGEATQGGANFIKPPLVEHSTALRTIFGDKQAMAEIRDELLEELHVVHSIDPDIMVMRSWSQMAKITFQRQRNVERALERAFSSGKHNTPGRYIHALASRLEKIMWGRS